jgi:hypothetical protein
MSLKVFIVSTNVFLGAKFCENEKNKNEKKTFFHNIIFFFFLKKNLKSQKKEKNFVTFEVRF